MVDAYCVRHKNSKLFAAGENFCKFVPLWKATLFPSQEEAKNYIDRNVKSISEILGWLYISGIRSGFVENEVEILGITMESNS